MNSKFALRNISNRLNGNDLNFLKLNYNIWRSCSNELLLSECTPRMINLKYGQIMLPEKKREDDFSLMVDLIFEKGTLSMK